MLPESTPPFEILLVEDESADAHLVRAALAEAAVRCQLHHVMDGVEALEYLRKQGAGNRTARRPDLILLDLNMPRMHGREFLAHIKADPLLAAIPVVVLSTSDQESDVLTAYRLGAAGYITKPVDMLQFVNAIQYLTNYWIKLVRLPKRDRT